MSNTTDGEFPHGTAYGAMLDSLADGIGPMALELRERSERRGRHLFNLLTWGRPLFDSLQHARAGFLWCAGLPGADKDIAHLCLLCAEAVVRGVESVLVESEPRAMDESRYLMEVQLLFEEFVREPERLDHWRGLTEVERHNEYSYGKVRSRAERAMGLPEGHFLSIRADYSLHSRAVHPTPAGSGNAAGANFVDGILWDAADLLGHAATTLRSAYGVSAATTSADSPEWEGWESVEPPALDLVTAALAFFFEDQPERPVSLHRTENLQEVMGPKYREWSERRQPPPLPLGAVYSDEIDLATAPKGQVIYFRPARTEPPGEDHQI